MITRQPNHLAGLAMFCQVVACAGSPREVWISPDGKDGGLPAARDALRGTRGTVHVHGGRYELHEPLVLDERDAGISFVAVSGERPVLSGGMIIDDLTQPLPVDDVRQIWIDGMRAPRSRGPVPELQLVADGYVASSPLTFSDPRALELIYFETWQHKLCGVDAIEGAHIIMRQPCFSFVTRDDGRPSTLPDRFEHAPELIDEPGEWYWNRATHTLAIAGDARQVIVPVAEQLVEMRGTSDIHFEGITFADTSWLRPSTDGLPDVQAGFVVDPLNTSPSSTDILVEGNAIARVMRQREDGAGIYVLGNQPGTVIRDNHIAGSTGSSGGIYLDEGTANVEVTGNSVSDVPVPYFPHTSREATCAVHDNFFGSDVDVGAGLTILA